MSFDALKKNRNAAIAQLVGAAEKLGNKNFGDDRFWTASVDKAGNGYAVIRFLPAPAGEDLPWIRYWDHGFKGPQTGRWYIENSLTSLELPDPVSESNSLLWNSGREEDKETARKRKRRLHYVSNILVISDPANRENEGKVFLFKYGKKIFDKCMEKMQPIFPGDIAVNAFDFWSGADFRLKICSVDDYRNYDKSEFANPSEVSSDETRLREIYEGLHSLKAFVSPSNFKTYAELKRKLSEVLGEESETAQMSPRQLMEHDTTQKAPRTKQVREPETIGGSGSSSYEDEAPIPFNDEGPSDDNSESLSYFAKLAKMGV